MRDGFSCLSLIPITFVYLFDWLIVLGFNDVSTLVGHFMSSPRKREKTDRIYSRADEREEEGRKTERNESEEQKKLKHSPSTITCYKDNRSCPIVRKYQLDIPVLSVCGGGGVSGRGVTRGNCGMVCEPVFRNLSHSYTWPLKNVPFIYLIVRNVDPFIYCPLIFYTHLLLVVRQI